MTLSGKLKALLFTTVSPPKIKGYNPKISNLMIFFILTTIVVQLVKFNMATLPFIQAYRRIKFKTITSDDQVVRDKNRNVFLIDSFTGPDFIFFFK